MPICAVPIRLMAHPHLLAHIATIYMWQLALSILQVGPLPCVGVHMLNTHGT